MALQCHMGFALHSTAADVRLHLKRGKCYGLCGGTPSRLHKSGRKTEYFLRFNVAMAQRSTVEKETLESFKDGTDFPTWSTSNCQTEGDRKQLNPQPIFGTPGS